MLGLLLLMVIVFFTFQDHQIVTKDVDARVRVRTLDEALETISPFAKKKVLSVMTRVLTYSV